jgi:hypothetical protein
VSYTAAGAELDGRRLATIDDPATRSRAGAHDINDRGEIIGSSDGLTGLQTWS